ncbi:MAG: tRNA (adenosine(37)-N6)-threonylcarbamoyltransferase complex dimerization subunit type 1 TsaB [Planctomycetes bacterium]|nr:tRNA (adenosine(37)-N6)-threonylcarbamoyltransferase complex dimerization subunit type 1 TsaB [Planctomycetota bacterium]
MRILALETSGTGGSVAALEGERLLSEVALPAGTRSGQMLHPALRDLLAQVAWQPVMVDLIAVTAGPGSFTGLRIGVTAAKTFAFATGCRLVGVSTLECLAAQAGACAGRVAAVMDAQRGELFACTFLMGEGGALVAEQPAAIVHVEPWLAGLQVGDVVVGAPLAKLRERLPTGVVVAPEVAWEPRAATVGLLAAGRAARGEFDDPWQLTPNYLRRSAAEEKRDG